MKVAIVTPVVLQSQQALEFLLEGIRTLRPSTSCAYHHRLKLSYHLLTNRLHNCGSREEVLAEVDAAWRVPGQEINDPYLVQVVNDRERTVAGAWNEGARRGAAVHADVILVAAWDARPLPGCVDALLDFSASVLASDGPRPALWSACPASAKPARETAPGCDCSLFCFPPETLVTYGTFDENFKPAYMEDNDYYARVILSGGEAVVVSAARYDHAGGGSQTVRRDPEFAHHVRHWWPINKDYFKRKWGVDEPLDDPDEIRARYHPTPFNSGRSLAWWHLEAGRE